MLKRIRENLIALISVLIAVSALFYSTWRLEVTERNRNVRIASFETLKALTDLQLLIDYAYYDKDTERGNPIKGWSYVIYVNDLSETISPDVKIKSDILYQSWQENWENISSQSAAQEAVTLNVAQTRASILAVMKSLE
jgi:hypothetical protein